MLSRKVVLGTGTIWILYNFLLTMFMADGQEMPAGLREDTEASCICNPEDNNTGAVCANDGKTYTSACDFRLKQGLRSDLGIRCVGSCPCDDSLVAVGIDCGTTAITQLTTPSSGLEFCGTNAVTYNNENMFMCDQVQDTSLAISCPGPCPCQLADCPSLFTERPQTRAPETTPAPRNTIYPPEPGVPSPGQPRPPASTAPGSVPPGYGTVQAQGGFGSRPTDSAAPVPVPLPAPTPPQAPSFTQAAVPWNQPVWSKRPPNNEWTSMNQPSGPPPPRPQLAVPLAALHSRPRPSSESRYATAPGGEPMPVAHDSEAAPPPAIVHPNAESRSLHTTREKSGGGNSLLPHAAYNPLTEALRSVPFRLFRHLYILITVASEGMKQIPFQIAKNMQSRLPPYVREIPIQVAEATQEALAIHFDSLARQIKDTVDAVRMLLDNDH